MKTIELGWEKCLLLVLTDYLSILIELLERFESVSIEAQRLLIKAYEAFQTLNDLNPNFIK